MAVLLITFNLSCGQPNQPRQEARTTEVEVVAPSSHTGHAVPAKPDKRNSEPSPLIIRAWLCAYALKHGVEPAAAMAVARIESGKGRKEFRVGRMGKTYLGPMGLHRCFLKKWDIDKPEVNIEVGVKALARHRDLKSALKKYNAVFDDSYWRAVKSARAHYSKVGVSGP